MAMTMTGDIQLHANREAVWAKLNDPAVLKSCIPGCEQLDMLSGSEFQAVATVKVGPVKTRWKGKVRLSDFDPPNSYRISGASNAQLPVRTKNQTSCNDRHQTSAQNADGSR